MCVRVRVCVCVDWTPPWSTSQTWSASAVTSASSSTETPSPPSPLSSWTTSRRFTRGFTTRWETHTDECESMKPHLHTVHYNTYLQLWIVCVITDELDDFMVLSDKCQTHFPTAVFISIWFWWVLSFNSFLLVLMLMSCPLGVRDGDGGGSGHPDEQWRVLGHALHQVHHLLKGADRLAVQRRQDGPCHVVSSMSLAWD